MHIHWLQLLVILRYLLANPLIPCLLQIVFAVFCERNEHDISVWDLTQAQRGSFMKLLLDYLLSCHDYLCVVTLYLILRQ